MIKPLDRTGTYGPFIQVNCRALPETLIDSELFGHEKGAFTSAVSHRLGRVELAEGGTLFLDEIGDMAVETQVKLLRLLEEGTFERVGSSETLTAKTRIVTATNRDLKEMVSAGDFREDLYYRLNAFPMYLPPLRDQIKGPEGAATLLGVPPSTLYNKMKRLGIEIKRGV